MDYLFSVAPGEIISFTDSDVYFKKGWLDATIKLFSVFKDWNGIGYSNNR